MIMTKPRRIMRDDMSISKPWALLAAPETTIEAPRDGVGNAPPAVFSARAFADRLAKPTAGESYRIHVFLRM